MSQREMSRYSGIAMSLHWLTVLLVLGAFILGPGGGEEHVYAAARDTQRELHETLGIIILLLTLLRMAWRWQDTQPSAPPVPPWMTLAARVVQITLYVLLFLLPMTAIAGAWLEGHPLTLMLGIKIGPLIGQNHALGLSIASLHTWLGDLIIWLAGLHALAGIYHHVMRKDTVLVSMLPRAIGGWLTHKE